MLQSLLERLSDAVEDGEVLTVIYSRGHSPGAKRRIRPVRVAGHIVYARSVPSMVIKSYRLDSLAVVEDSNPAPWIDDVALARQKPIRLDPVKYFDSWVYSIRKPLWSALGVSLREYVDKEKSAVLRASLQSNNVGKSRAEAISAKYMAYAVGNPPVFDFHEGDLFYSAAGGFPAIQVVAKRKLVEVHHIFVDPTACRRAYQLVDEELADWLKTGICPEHARIDAAQSYSDVLRFGIVSSSKNSSCLDT